VARLGGDELAVLREADVAMYTAKAHGKGRFELAATSA
jgi:PleD family two-component response regulator